MIVPLIVALTIGSLGCDGGLIPDIKCDICVMIGNYIHRSLKSNKTRDEIAKYLMETCSFFPKELKDECQGFVTVYLEEFFDNLLDLFDFSKICHYTGYCATYTKAESPDTCLKCHKLIKTGKKLSSSRFLQPMAASSIEKACTGVLSPFNSSECVTHLQGDFKSFITKAGLVDPMQLCVDLQLCSVSGNAEKSYKKVEIHAEGEALHW